MMDMQNEEQANANEVGLKNLLVFLRQKRRQLAVAVGLAMLFAATLVVVMPRKYEARWQLQMAQLEITQAGAASPAVAQATVAQIMNIEEPIALAQRLRSPTAYPLDVRKSCGKKVEGDFDDYLDGMLKIETVKNVPNAVDMKVISSSPDRAEKCAEAVTAMIVAQQRNLIEERLAGRQGQLKDYEQALAAEQEQLEKIKKSDLGNFGYLARLDKLSWLRMRIDALREESMLSQKHPAKLVVPIYVPSKPVSPKVGLTLVLGAVLGLMLGVLYALGRDGWRKTA